MKPRLKRTHDGRLIVISAGSNPWGELSARKYIQEHYGSLSAFAACYHFSYGAVRHALQASSSRMAGQVAVIRQALGLPSNPSSQGLNTVRGHLRKQESRA